MDEKNSGKNGENTDGAVAESEDEDRFVILGAITDNSNIQYQVEWQRISNMQQSAGVLVAAIAIVVAGVMTLIGMLNTNLGSNEAEYANAVLLPLIGFSILFLSFSSFHFFKVVWPSKVDAFPLPMKIYNKTKTFTLDKAMLELILISDICLSSMHDLVEKKQKHYRRALISCTTAFASMILLIISVITKLPWIHDFNILYYFILSIAAVLVVIFTYFRE